MAGEVLDELALDLWESPSAATEPGAARSRTRRGRPGQLQRAPQSLLFGLRHDHDMALTALLDVKRSPVRRFMDRELPAAAPVCKEANAAVRAGRSGDPPLAPGPGVDSGLVGTAVEYVLPIPHGSVRKPLMAPAPTRELADLRLQTAELAVAELRRLGGLAEPLIGPALERAADCALVCARLEQRRRIGGNTAHELRLPDPAVGVGLVGGLDGAIEAALASAETRVDLVALLEAGLIDTADLYSADALAIGPSFALSGAVDGADADVIADGTLIDFKTGKGRSLVGAKEIYQLIGYALLDIDDRYKITGVAIHALRWRSRWTVTLDDLLLRLSGVQRNLGEWRTIFAETLGADEQQLTAIRERGSEAGATPHNPDHAAGV